tara:strand:+ start:83 stop:247 length:165 start_codon:yes stop_codon:yes gene_type:complete
MILLEGLTATFVWTTSKLIISFNVNSIFGVIEKYESNRKSIIEKYQKMGKNLPK